MFCNKKRTVGESELRRRRRRRRRRSVRRRWRSWRLDAGKTVRTGVLSAEQRLVSRSFFSFSKTENQAYSQLERRLYCPRLGSIMVGTVVSLLTGISPIAGWGTLSCSFSKTWMLTHRCRATGQWGCRAPAFFSPPRPKLPSRQGSRQALRPSPSFPYLIAPSLHFPIFFGLGAWIPGSASIGSNAALHGLPPGIKGPTG